MTIRNEDLPLDVVEFLADSELNREKVFRAGKTAAIRNLALWDEVLECEVANKPKPDWARQALIAYAKKQYANSKHREQRQIAWDARVLESVKQHLERSHKPKSAKAPRRFTLRRACQYAARDLYPKNREITPELIQNVRRAYERAQKQKKAGYYISFPALKSL